MRLKNSFGVAVLRYLMATPTHRGKELIARLTEQLVGLVDAQTPDGDRLKVRLTSSMDRSYFRSEPQREDAAITSCLKRLCPGDLFIDIGANIGYYTLDAAHRVGTNGRVYAFEPSLGEFARLCENIQINGIQNVLAYNVALSSNNGEASLAIAPFHTGLHKLMSSIPPGWSQRLVPLATGDALLGHLIGQDIAGIKLDVEGAELLVLKGLRQLLASSKIDWLVVEITPRYLAQFGDTAEALYAYLEVLGYIGTVQERAWQYDEVFVRRE